MCATLRYDGGGAASEFRHVFNMGWTHHARVVSSHIHEEAVQSYVLLGKGVTQVVNMAVR